MIFLLNITTVVGPVLLCALVGFALGRFKQPFDAKVITSLVTNIGMPCLIVSHLAAQHVAFGEFTGMMLGALAAIICFGVISVAFLLALRLPLRVYVSPMIFANVGNIGLSICAFAFGAQGLAYAIAFWIVVVIGTFTVGTWIPQGRFSLERVLRAPAIYAVVLGLALLGTETPLPPLFQHALTLLGGISIPLMLLTLGHTIAGMEARLLTRGALIACFHLAMTVVVALALTSLFDFRGTARGVFILQCLMPAGVTAYLWAEQYNRERAPEVASLALMSTLLAIVSLPVVLTIWV